MTALQGGLTATDPVQLSAQLLGVGIAAATAAGLAALGYRWYVRERIPTGLAVLFGLSVVVVGYVGTTGALGAVIAGDDAVLDSRFVLQNLAAFAIGAAGSSVGMRAGDGLGTDLFAATGGRSIDADVSEIVQTVGRVTSMKLPEEINDIIGYDPMPETTKEALSGKRLLFPRRLTKNELRDRLVSRLKTDYGVGHVDVELGDDGNVEYLAVGSRAAGIGPTLPPATNAVAIRADPANAASSGDLVQVWEPNPPQRVLTGELRGVADDVVTVAIDAADTPKLDSETRYKLVTLPVQDRPDREFASLLRAAEETMATVTVPAGSELVGTDVGDLGVTVAAVTREDSPTEAIPTRDRVLEAGDIIYAIAKPDGLRSVEAAANRQREAETPVADDVAPDESESDDDGELPDGNVEETSTDEADDDGALVSEAESGVGGTADGADATTDTETAVDEEVPSEEGDGETDIQARSSEPAPEGRQSEASEADEPETKPDESEPEVEESQTETDEPASGEDGVTVWDPEERLDDDTPGDDDTPAEERDDDTK